VPLSIKLKLYFAHIHLHFYYCNLVWGQASPTNIQPLINLQKRAVRIIMNSSYRAHTAPMLNHLGITQLQHVFKYRLILMLRNPNHRFYDFLNLQNATTVNNTRQDGLFSVPRTRLHITDTCLTYSVAPLLNY